jgi:hypothetical protein
MMNAEGDSSEEFLCSCVKGWNDSAGDWLGRFIRRNDWPFIHGSAKGFPDGEKASIKNRFMGHIELGKDDEGCRRVLRTLHICRP